MSTPARSMTVSLRRLPGEELAQPDNTDADNTQQQITFPSDFSDILFFFMRLAFIKFLHSRKACGRKQSHPCGDHQFWTPR